LYNLKKSSVDFNSYLLPSCFPSSFALPENTTTWATGWGATSEGGSITPNLMQVSMPMLSDSKCQKKYSSINPTAQMYF
jgi:hypothetical protein